MTRSAHMVPRVQHGFDMQTFRMTTPPPNWPPVFRGPHAASLTLAENPRRPLDCSKVAPPKPQCAGSTYPSMEQLLCSLVKRADGAAVPSGDGTCPAPWMVKEESTIGQVFETLSGLLGSLFPRRS